MAKFSHRRRFCSPALTLMTMQIIIIKLNSEASPVGICKLDFIMTTTTTHTLMMDDMKRKCISQKLKRKITGMNEMSRENIMSRGVYELFLLYHFILTIWEKKVVLQFKRAKEWLSMKRCQFNYMFIIKLCCNQMFLMGK